MFILILAAGLWVSEAIPAFAVGILVIGLQVAILGRPGGVFATDPSQWKIFIEPWGSSLIWLFFGGFVLARGIQNSGLDRGISLAVLKRFGTRTSNVLLGAMVVTFAFSMFASNTATAAMMIAVLAPLVASRDDDPYRKALVLGVSISANLGGMGTLIGTPPNAIAAGHLAEVQPIGFAHWMLLGLPPASVLLIIAWLYLVRAYPPRVPTVDLACLSGPSRRSRLPLWQQLIVIVGSLATVGAWLSEPFHGISPTVVALVPVTLFTVSGVLHSNDIRALEWDVLLLLAGGLSLGVGVKETGLAAWLVDKLPLDASPMFATALLAAITLGLSNVMSNTATANIVIPMAMALAPEGQSGAMVVPIALAASIAMCLPVSTPPNAIAFASNHVETRDFSRSGLLLGGLGLILATTWVMLIS